MTHKLKKEKAITTNYQNLSYPEKSYLVLKNVFFSLFKAFFFFDFNRFLFINGVYSKAVFGGEKVHTDVCFVK